jgi:phosphate transport system protein
LPHIAGLHAIGTLAVKQVRDVLVAYRDGNIEAAKRVRASDIEIDSAYTGLFRELLTYMMEDARSITPCTHLLFCAKNIERIGDHATNIAENIWFLERAKSHCHRAEAHGTNTASRPEAHGGIAMHVRERPLLAR